MPLIVHCLDHSSATDLRLAHHDAHKAGLSAARIKPVITGPLCTDGRQTRIGSCCRVEAERLAKVRAFNAAGPFKAANLSQTISNRPLRERVGNRV